jgi:hypothetical protein
MLSCHVSSRVCEFASFAVLIVRVVLFVVARCLKLVLVFGALIVSFGGLTGHVCELGGVVAAVWVKVRLMSLWIEAVAFYERMVKC